MFREDMLFDEIQNNLPQQLNIENIGCHTHYDVKVLDGSLNLSFKYKKSCTLYYTIKINPRKETLIHWEREVFSSGMKLENTILLCSRMTSSLQEYCFIHEINFLDDAGNACIQNDNYLIYISGRKSKQKYIEHKSLSLSIMKLLFILLSDKEAINYPYRHLAELSNVSLGSVNNSFEFLVNNNFCRDSSNGRRLINTKELAQLWIREYPLTLRPKLKKQIFLGNGDWTEISLYKDEFFGGEAAAYQLSGGYLIPEKVQIFTPHLFSERRRELNLIPSQEGSFELVQSFWGRGFLVNDYGRCLLSVAELLASQDSRNIEIAEKINDEYL